MPTLAAAQDLHNFTLAQLLNEIKDAIVLNFFHIQSHKLSILHEENDDFLSLLEIII